jgi:predicted DNA-binding transcriptional regulator AlpA
MGVFVQRQLITPPVPRLLGMPHAAAFLGLSERNFEKLWRGGHLPPPHRLGRRLLWDLKLLDRFVDQLSGLEPAHKTIDDNVW